MRRKNNCARIKNNEAQNEILKMKYLELLLVNADKIIC